MRLNGLSLFRIPGIEIVIDYSWFLIFCLVIFTMAGSYFPQPHEDYTALQYWIMDSVAAVLLFLSILVHELAHSFVAVRHGIHVSGIRSILFGGGAQNDSEPKNGRQEFLIALAGPAISMAIGMSFLMVCVLFYLTGGTTLVAEIAFWLFLGNVGLAILNLIPGFPLDGGRILRAVLWDRWNDRTRATKTVSRLGGGFALFLILFGIMQFLFTRDLIFGLWLSFVGLLMKHSAAGIYQAVMLRQTLDGVQVQQIMTQNVVTVDWLISVVHLVHDYVYKHHFTDFPVFNRDEFIGMVSLKEVKTISKDLWDFKQVRDIMIPVEHVVCLKPTDEATEVLSRMISGDIGRMPVVEEGRLVGIVSRRDIMSLFQIKSDLGVA